MKLRIKKRRVFKWLGLVLNFFLITAFAASLKISASVYYRGYSVSVRYGCLFMSAENTNRNLQFSSWRLIKPMMWTHWPEVDTQWRRTRIILPIWIPLLLAAVVTVWLWKWDRPPKSGCVKCGYNLTGNVSGICPECGVPIPCKEFE
ncbi:MAG: hypothetical protein GXP29_07505 [Planctomycetes bacterium]|nr:hypothetical protein [Planctomycetota bacterium]